MDDGVYFGVAGEERIGSEPGPGRARLVYFTPKADMDGR
jgi:hypothetical protein